MTPSHECLYDVKWQRLRLESLQGWETEEGIRASISILLNYVGGAQGRYWKFVRVWRCRNVVNFALRTAEKHESAVGIRLIKTFSKGLEIEYDRYKGSIVGPLFKSWNWRKVSADLTLLYNSDREMFNRLHKYSESRLYAGGKQHPTDTASTPELAKFVRLMRDVEFEHG